MMQINPPGDWIEPGGYFSLAVDGDDVHWAWLTYDWEIWTRRSTDGGRSVEPAREVYAGPNYYEYPGAPRIEG